MDQSVFSQEITMLDNVRAFTSSDEFIANNIYKVVRHNFSEDGSINLQIEGDISSFEFSLALISMLPAFDKLPIKKNLNIKYSNLNKENLEEALLIEAVKSIYPDQIVEYLMTRAECFFEVNGLQVIEEMKMDVDKIQDFKKDSSIKRVLKKKKSEGIGCKSLVLVNDIDFKMIPSFYAGSGEPSLYLDKSGSCDWGHIDCVSRILNNMIQHNLKSELLSKSKFESHEFVFNQKDIYVSLVSCSFKGNLTYFENLELRLFSSNELEYLVENSNYSGVVRNFSLSFYEFLCKRKPCHAYSKYLQALYE